MTKAQAFAAYTDALRTIPIRDKAELTDRGALETLLKAFAPEGVTVQHEPRREGKKGSPDFKITKKGLVLGYVEVKKIGADLKEVAKSDQIKKYKTLSGNLLLTDYLTFKPLARGKRPAVLMGEETIRPNGHGTPDDAAVEAVQKVLDAFYSAPPEDVSDPEELAEALARRCRLLRDALSGELERQEKTRKDDAQDDETESLYALFEVFQNRVFADLTLKEFCDAFAQTLGYGLFLAKFNAETVSAAQKQGDLTGTAITLRNAKDFIPQTFELIGELVGFLDALRKDQYAEARWIVEEILFIVNGIDVGTLHDALSFRNRKIPFRKKRARSEDEARLFERDPYVYFYETFLAAYDQKTRESRGVYYTPPPVVSFIVRAIDEVLRSEFGKSKGIADRGVTALDFACGTGTFMVEFYQQALAALGEDKGKARKLVREHLLKNVYGFEFLIAPYTIAHLKLSQFLADKGYSLGKNDRAQVYLTNTLEEVKTEGAKGEQSDLLVKGFFPKLVSETKQANEIKERKLLVIMGNPPYSGHSRNNGAYAKGLVAPYKEIDGVNVAGSNSKWLQDDYVKFLAFAERKMREVPDGVVGVVTNHSFIDNPTFGGMRHSLLKTFQDVYVLDLHGNRRHGGDAAGRQRL